MKNTIDIDIGGTFTDCYMVFDGKRKVAKSPTTKYNLSVGFRKVLEEGAESLEMSLKELLSQTDIIRYSTTIGTNALIERSGPKLGLLTTEGFEDTIYIGRARQWADGVRSMAEYKNLSQIDKPLPLIPRTMTIGLRERIDCKGNVIIPLKKEDVFEKLQYLVDQGAMGFVVCLLWSFLNPVHEQMVRQIIEEEYPPTYLGNMPVVLSSDVSPKFGEYARSMTAILSAYIHKEMVDQLADLQDELRSLGYKRPLLITQNSGGIAKVSKTMAVSTHQAGPVAGLLGSSFLGCLYGMNNIIVTDMGGTSFDIGMVAEGSAQFYEFLPVIDRWRVQLNILETKSIGAGGGSIASFNHLLGRLEVGPKSAGAFPGPVAYDLGGTEPTVTDADLVLGYIDPEYYLGGRMPLDKDKAHEAIKEKIARPMGLEVEEAALAIKRTVDAYMGQEIYKEISLKGFDPRKFVLFAYGGGGPTHCTGYSQHIDVPRIITFPFSPVFSAFGASTLDFLHLYHRSKHFILYNSLSNSYFDDYEAFNSIIRELQRAAFRDMQTEGFKSEEIFFSLEADMKFGTQLYETKGVKLPVLFVNSEEDVKAICDAFIKAYSEIYSAASAYPEGGIELETLTLRAIAPMDKPEFPVCISSSSSPEKAFKGHREALWEKDKDFKKTNIYEYQALQCGNVVEGPAIIEADHTTIVIPEGYLYTLDQYLSGVIEPL